MGEGGTAVKKLKWAWRVLGGAALGLVFSVVLVSYAVGTRGPSPVVCLLCSALGAAAGVATLTAGR